MNVGELRTAIANLPDETNVYGLYDGGFGIAEDPQVFIEDSEPVAVVIDFDPAWRTEES